MKKILESNKILILLGNLITLAMLIPFFINGENAIITYHDQLDGELITYLLNAKYLFQGQDVYPELMNGIPAAGMVSPAPAYILLFKFLPPFIAFMTGLVVLKFVAFNAMYLLLREISQRKWLAFVAAVCFMALPFYMVYGLCIPGQPLFLLALYKIKAGDWKSSVKWYAVLAVYALFSSLALVGFACILLAGIWALKELISKKMMPAMRLFVGAGVLTAFYGCTNISLVQQILGKTAFVSHKSEIVLTAIDFWDTVQGLLLSGDDYTGAQQKYMLLLICTAVVCCIVLLIKRKTINSHFVYALCVNVVITLLVAVYRSEAAVSFRNASEGVLHDFNFGRISWLMAVHWYVLVTAAVEVLLDTIKSFKKAPLWSGITLVCSVMSFTLVFVSAVYTSDLKSNIAKIIKGKDYYMMTYKQFYAEDLFGEIDALIGRPKEEYRVISLGIYSSVAAYNGFYCLDAYSNNYDITYKHEFRKIIENELAKSEYLTNWYDNWGNRCCMVLAESNNYFTFEKRWSPVSYSVELNVEQLKSMGCEYIISASYIMEPEPLGLTLLNEEPIMTEGSWYRMWVYQIEDFESIK